jgi:predicted DNA-binding protein (MmcQ/YjbR family)
MAKRGVTEGFPFGGDVLVFKVMDKIFAISPLDRYPPQANLKCDPERAIDLRERYAGRILPGYHMNKALWNTIHLEELPEELIRVLTDHSYELIVASLPKKSREALRNAT